MQKLKPDELMPLEEYHRQRAEFRHEVMAH